MNPSTSNPQKVTTDNWPARFLLHSSLLRRHKHGREPRDLAAIKKSATATTGLRLTVSSFTTPESCRAKPVKPRETASIVFATRDSSRVHQDQRQLVQEVPQLCYTAPQHIPDVWWCDRRRTTTAGPRTQWRRPLSRRYNSVGDRRNYTPELLVTLHHPSS
jgi:hypothetical protein